MLKENTFSFSGPQVVVFCCGGFFFFHLQKTLIRVKLYRNNFPFTAKVPFRHEVPPL